MALAFDGISDLIEAPLALPQSTLTVSLWIRQAVLSDGAFFATTDGAGNYHRTIQVNSDGSVTSRIWDSSGNILAHSPVSLTPGVWSHVLYRSGAQTGWQRLAVSGVPTTNASPFDTYPQTQTHICMGVGKFFGPAGQNLGEVPFAGELAEVAVWDEELTDSEEALLASAASPLCLTSRIGSLRFYRDFLRTPNRPGIGPPAAVTGSPAVASHPRVYSPLSMGLNRGPYPRSPAPYGVFIEEIATSGGALGETVQARAEQGQATTLYEVPS